MESERETENSKDQQEKEDQYDVKSEGAKPDEVPRPMKPGVTPDSAIVIWQRIQAHQRFIKRLKARYDREYKEKQDATVISLQREARHLKDLLF